MENGVSNGTRTPETPKPKHANLALTEYTIQPSPPCATPREKIEHAGVPADYLLPTGYPDVKYPYIATVSRSANI
jgi:threonine dehydratase